MASAKSEMGNCDGCGAQEKFTKLAFNEGKNWCHDCSNMRNVPGRGTFVGDAETSFGGGFGGLSGIGGLMLPSRINMAGLVGNGPKMPFVVQMGLATGKFKNPMCVPDGEGGFICTVETKKKNRNNGGGGSDDEGDNSGGGGGRRGRGGRKNRSSQ